MWAGALCSGCWFLLCSRGWIMANHVKAVCGHDVLAFGAPGSIARNLCVTVPCVNCAAVYAAGPKLLAALERLLDAPCCNEDDQEDETCEAIRHAISVLESLEAAKGGA